MPSSKPAVKHSVKFNSEPILLGEPQNQQPGNKMADVADKNRHASSTFPPLTYRFIPDLVAWLFSWYGFILGKYPWLFLIAGIITGLAASAGLWRIQLATDPDQLVNQFLEGDSRYFHDDAVIKNWINLTQRSYMLRSTRQASSTSCRETRTESVLIVSRGDNLFNEETFEELHQLSGKLRGILDCSRQMCCEKIDFMRFSDAICQPKCQSINDLVTIFSSLQYPVDKFANTTLSNFLGGVVTDDENNVYNARIERAKAMMFVYYLPATTATLDRERTFSHELKTLAKTFEHVDVYWQTWQQLENEFLLGVFDEAPKVAVTFVCVILWCVTGALHRDALTSKPWNALVGISCTALACLSGFGAQFWLGSQFYTYLIAVPLMALAVGLDDMFILLGNWHRTDVTLPRETRAMLTMREGGTSIFVTALMTMIDFIIGTYTPYPAINSYSHFALWCLAFDFWLQMTIFVSVLTLSDSCEKREKHSCCCCMPGKLTKRTNRSIYKKSSCGIMCCTYGIPGHDENLRKPEVLEVSLIGANRSYENIIFEIENGARLTQDKKADNEQPRKTKQMTKAEKFVFKHIAPAILHPGTRIMVAALLIAFLTGSLAVIWTRMEIGFRPEHLANRMSNTYDFNIFLWRYFRDFANSQQIQLLFNFTTKPYDRDFVKIKNHVVEIIERFEHLNAYFWDKRTSSVPIRDIVLPDEDILSLEIAIQRISHDTRNAIFKPELIDPYEDFERIVFFATLQTRSITTLKRGSALAQYIKDTQDMYEDGTDFQILVSDYEKTLRVYNQIVNLPKQLVYFALITFGSTTLVAVVMIPHPICVFWLALSSGSIIIGTLAGMVSWGVSLDPVSLIYVLMSIGATADYICHSIYLFTIIIPTQEDFRKFGKFTKSNKITTAEIRYGKARQMIVLVVSETVPAVVGTLLSIVVLSTTNFYVIQAFFKVFIISVAVAVAFMGIVLPIALCQFGPIAFTCCHGNEESVLLDYSKNANISYSTPNTEAVELVKTVKNQAFKATSIRHVHERTNKKPESSQSTSILRQENQVAQKVTYKKKPKTNQASAIKSANSTWKEKMMDRFLSDVTVHSRPVRAVSLGALHNSDGHTPQEYVNVSELYKSNPSRTSSGPVPVAYSDGIYRNNRNIKHEAVYPISNKSRRSVLHPSSKFNNEEQYRRSGAQRTTLNS